MLCCAVGALALFTAPAHAQTRWLAPPDTQWYVDGTNGNDANDGRSPATAVQTLQRCADTVQYLVDLSLFGLNQLAPTCNVLPGVYTDYNQYDLGVIQSYGTLLGATLLRFSGDCSNPTSAIIQARTDGSNLPAVFVKDRGTIGLRCLQVNGPVLVQQTGLLDIMASVTIGPSPSLIWGQLHADNGGHIIVAHKPTVTGGGLCLLCATSNSTIQVYGGAGATFATAGVTYAAATAYADNASTIVIQPGSYFDGPGAPSVNGVRFLQRKRGGIDTLGVDPNVVFPGSIPGDNPGS